jgi:hypothetical protein
MPEKSQQGGASFTWYIPEFKAGVAQLIERRMMGAGEYLRARVVKNIGASSRSAGPSKEGEFPHADTGALRNSIFWRLVKGAGGEVTVTVGTTLAYGIYLEFGTAGGVRVEARPGSVLSWIDPRTGERRYARWVTLGAIKGRSFLRRTLQEEWPAVRRMLGAPAGELKLTGSAA